MVVDAALTDARNKNCSEIALESFVPTSMVNGQYIRFTVKSQFGLGAGIQFFGWEPRPVGDGKIENC